MLPLRIKRMFERSHLVKHTSKRPDIRFEVVLLILEQLRGHVIRRADTGLSKVSRSIQNLHIHADRFVRVLYMVANS